MRHPGLRDVQPPKTFRDPNDGRDGDGRLWGGVAEGGGGRMPGEDEGRDSTVSNDDGRGAACAADAKRKD